MPDWRMNLIVYGPHPLPLGKELGCSRGQQNKCLLSQEELPWPHSDIIAMLLDLLVLVVPHVRHQLDQGSGAVRFLLPVFLEKVQETPRMLAV